MSIRFGDRRLKYFAAVAELGSFSRAATVLRVSQPAVSRHVRLMEEEIGSPLLVRESKGVKLTETGKLVLKHANIISKNISAMVEEIYGKSSNPTGVVSIGIPPSISNLLVPRLVNRVLAQYPGISLRIHEGLTHVLVDWVSNSVIEVALTSYPIQSKNVTFTPVADDEMVVVMPRGRPNYVPIHELDQIIELPLIASSVFLDLLRIDMDMANCDFNIICEVDSVHAIKSMINEGIGATIAPVSFFSNEIASGAMCASRITTRGIRRHLSLCRSIAAPPSVITELVIDVCTAEIEELRREGAFSLDLGAGTE